MAGPLETVSHLPAVSVGKSRITRPADSTPEFEVVQPDRKRSRHGDTFRRRILVASTTTSRNTKSYVRCPLCGDLSQKTYALGRGIATHLQTIHTPWKPTKPSRRLARRIWERENRMKPIEDQSTTWIQPEINKEYEPTPSEVEGWEATVARLVRQVEDEATSNDNRAQGSHGSGSVPQKDRSGHLISVYKDSLPPFLQAAAIGQIDILSRMMTEAGDDVNTLLHQCDRHGSIAEHWAAGGGNLECLRLLMESKSSVVVDEPPRPCKRPRRRDGKTCLHYAARNGQLHCIRYLVETQQMDLDEASGEGTTPLHMACYGGHLPVIHYFVEHAAKQSLPNPALAANEWGCQASHWVAMTLNDNAEQVWDMCTYLQGCGVDFGARQLQGHSPLHKAAHRRNRHVLEWMVGAQSALTKEDLVAAAAPDEGGNTPSDIWKSVGGDPDVFKWMKSEGW